MTLNLFLVSSIIAVCGSFTNSAPTNDQELEIGHYYYTLRLYTPSTEDYILSSPLITYAGVAVVGFGLGEQYRDILYNGLRMPKSHAWEELHKTLANKFSKAQTNQNANLTTATGYFVQDGFQLKEPFKKFVQDIYKVKIENVDFAKNGQKTLDTIQSWESENTGGRMKEIGNKEPYDPITLAILINELYFRVNWQTKFKKLRTFPLEFNAYGQNKTLFNFIFDTSYVQYYEDTQGKFRSIGIPFENEDFSIYFVLPNEDTTLQLVIDNFRVEHFQKVTNADTQLIEFKIPHAELEFKAKTEVRLCPLNDHGINKKKQVLVNVADRYTVCNTTHKVDLKINEDAAIGSAETASEEVPSSDMPHYPPPKSFIVNRPYLFFIQQKSTKFLIINGFVNKPSFIKSEA